MNASTDNAARAIGDMGADATVRLRVALFFAVVEGLIVRHMAIVRGPVTTETSYPTRGSRRGRLFHAWALSDLRQRLRLYVTRRTRKL